MRNWILAAAVAIFAASLVRGDDGPAQHQTVIETSEPMTSPLPGVLGTRGYPAMKREIPFLNQVTEVPIDYWAQNPMPPAEGEKAVPDPAEDKRRAGELRKAQAYTLAAESGQYVGWFGIVRKVSWNEKEGRTELLLEHKYFDGACDLDIQVVSLYGAGDFRAVLPQQARNITDLSLVRVYGKVAKDKDGNAEVSADYIRVWDWGLFTFMDYGIDKSNPEWVKLRKLSGSDAYSPHPTKQFYEELLGKRQEGDAAGPADVLRTGGR